MALTDQELIYASLIGSGIVRQLPQLSAINNELQKHVLPVVPVLPPSRNTDNSVQAQPAIPRMAGLYENRSYIPEDQQFFPLSLSLTENGPRFMLPYETMINIDEKNILSRRTVAKWKDDAGVGWEGTVKERISRDDSVITVAGLLMGSLTRGTVDQCYPWQDFVRLRDFLRAAKALWVWSEPLQLAGINRIAVEDFSWPFTKGQYVQAYTFKAYSDKSFNLVLT